MYVQNTRENKNKKLKNNAYSTLTLLNSFLKIFGLNCITSDRRKLRYSWPIWKIAFTTTVFFTVDFVSIYFALKWSNRKKAGFQDYFVLIYMLGFIQYVVDLTFIYKYGRQRCLNYYTVFENIDSVIGMPYYNEIKRSVAKTCIFFIIFVSCYFLSDCTALALAYGWFITVVNSIDYFYTAIKMLSALDAIAHLTQVKFRLKRIEDILRDYYSTVACLPGVTKDVICKKDWIKTVYDMPNRFDSLATIGCNRFNVILHLSRCYLLLLEQCDYINGMFGFRILFGGLVYLMEMVMLINLTIRLILRTMIPFYQSSVFTILSTTMKIVNYSLIVLCGMNYCEQIYKQTERIVRCIDHLLTNKKIAMEAHEALQELRELIITRPISFNAVNFYTLGYTTMLSIASAVITYTIILLQNVQ